MTKSFKRIIALCLASLMLASSYGVGAAETAWQAQAPNRILGDINNDGNVDVNDAMDVFRYSMIPHIYPIDYPGTLDFDKNNSVDIADAMWLFQYSMLPDMFPIEWGDINTPETEAPETEAPETERPENFPGDCGHILWNESNNMVGPMCMDAFTHLDSQVNYREAASTGTVTVEEDSGRFQILGWIPMSFTNFELAWRLDTYSDTEYNTTNAAVVQREPAVYQAAQSLGYTNATGFSFIFDIATFNSGQEIHLFMKDKDTNTTYCFAEITVNTKYADPEANAALLEKYALGKGSNMKLDIPDPITNHEPVTAPDDDPAMKLWFDHITEKVARYDVSGKDSGKTSYTIQMGKNETEGCQFFLYSPTPRKITIRISDFENANGDKLKTELGVEYYIEDGYLPHLGYPEEYVYPDAVVPYDSYIACSSNTENGAYGTDAKNKLGYGPYVCVGPFSGSASDHVTYPFRDSVRGFVLEATAEKDAAPGAYKATIEILDADTGAVIKAANVYTYVYNVTLSDETALDTAFGLWDISAIYNHHYSSNPKLTRYSSSEITRATADFFLRHRITLTGNASFYATMGEEWFENPRVTSIRVVTKEQYDLIKDNPVLAEKMFYYGQDEPAVPRGWRPITWPDGTSETVYDNTGLLSVLAVAKEADQLKNVWGWEDYRLITPFERTIDFTNFDWNSVDMTTAFPKWYEDYAVGNKRDSLEYLLGSVTIWNPVFKGSTPRELAPAIIGDLYMQSESQDAIFGEFQSRLDTFQAQGDELWYYVSCEPKYTSPYQNILLFNDGTEGRTMFWSTYQLGGTGFLYWHVSYYDAAGNNTYTLRCPFSKTGPGDGILVYPGSAYNQLDPIPSIRLLNMRDGIEDYQLLTMLKDELGETFTDELVSHIVTSTVTFTRDDDKVYNAHALMLKTLEEAGK